MKKLLVVLSMVLASSAAQASNANVKFVAKDSSIESKLCVVAAESGYKAAINEAKLLGSKYEAFAFVAKCNGQSLRAFAESFQVKAVIETPEVAKLTLVRPANKSIESQLCASAAKNGIDAIQSEVNYDVRELVCNGMSLTRFVKYNKSI